MLKQGKIAQWNDARGFGFITPDDATRRVFVHISAFRHRYPLPQAGERVFYYLGAPTDKGPRAEAVQYMDRVQEPLGWKGRRSSLHVFAQCVVLLVLFMAFAVVAAWWYRSAGYSVAPVVSRALPAKPDPQFSCAGKTRCDQMISCAEAKFYLAHCPGVAIDGDYDGEPCEQTLCRRW